MDAKKSAPVPNRCETSAQTVKAAAQTVHPAAAPAATLFTDQCLSLLASLVALDCSEPFRAPVDNNQYPDYYQVSISCLGMKPAFLLRH